MSSCVPWKADLCNVQTTCWTYEESGLIPGRAKDFSLLQSIQNGSGVHPVSYSKCTRSSRVKDEARRETGQSLPTSAKVTIAWSCVSNPEFFRGLIFYYLYIVSVVFLLCNKFDSRSQWPCGLRRKSAAVCLLRFESHRVHECLSVVSVVCSQLEVSATSWSLVQRSLTDCGASLCMI
jgi:hypothetical protein